MTVTVTAMVSILSFSPICTCIIQWGTPFTVGDPVWLVSTDTYLPPPPSYLSALPLC